MPRQFASPRPRMGGGVSFQPVSSTLHSTILMLHNARARLIAVILVLTAPLAACTQRETPQASARQVATSPGEVVATTGLARFDDSMSARADRARIRGSESAQVWLVEISDFQCPFCKQWHDETFAKIDQEYVKSGKVRLAYLNFPLSRIHKNAQAAAEAAMCAGVQGKFWELHESLFETQPKWAELKSPMAVFDSLARAAKVEPKGWSSCMSTHATAKLIQADRDRSTQAGVESTPTFFIGDRALAGAYPVDTFRVVLDQAIAKAKAPH
jgi:protein-disulfide isomerase